MLMFPFLRFFFVTVLYFRLTSADCGDSHRYGASGGVMYLGRKEDCSWTFQPRRNTSRISDDHFFTVRVLYVRYYTVANAITMPDDSILARQDIMSDSESVCFNYVMRRQLNAKCEPDKSLFETCNSTFRNITEWPPQLSMSLTGYIQFGMSFAFSECNRTSGTKIFESCQDVVSRYEDASSSLIIICILSFTTATCLIMGAFFYIRWRRYRTRSLASLSLGDVKELGRRVHQMTLLEEENFPNQEQS
ncbi:uncharacterized protein LOC143459887 [Clavelina lepadiformis]|uniref:Uncharacterized protein n=1 Tax=Clavelina lepadiformis TaxID=159417 RepID=A0ABP0F7N4_CLALP